MDALENTTEFREGQTVRCKKDDPADAYYGIAEHLRWHIGDEFVVTEVDVKPYGIFLHDGKGHNLSAKRAEIVK